METTFEFVQGLSLKKEGLLVVQDRSTVQVWLHSGTLLSVVKVKVGATGVSLKSLGDTFIHHNIQKDDDYNRPTDGRRTVDVCSISASSAARVTNVTNVTSRNSVYRDYSVVTQIQV
jgi:hypothetical protein